MNKIFVALLSLLLIGCASPSIPIKAQSLTLNLASLSTINEVTKIQKPVKAFAIVSKTKPCIIWMPILKGPKEWWWLKLMYEELRHCDGWRHKGDTG